MTPMLKKIFFGSWIILAFSGCLKSSDSGTNSCDYDPCALKAPASEIQSVQDYLAANNLAATQHCSGLFYSIDSVGTGANPGICSIVTVTYQGKLTNGTVFDSSSSPVAFNLYQVIPGWRNGLPQIKAGGKIHLYIPPSLAYGSTAAGSIPPNSILIFRVNLLAVQ
jgi:FKBP-type peptidyl-prolyl cis-trans isomerase FkpA